MGDLLHKLKRRQLLELLVSQGKELETQQQAAEAAQARVAELEAKLDKVTSAALEAAVIVEQAKREAEAYLQARKAEAEEQAQAILAAAREGRPLPTEEPPEEEAPAAEAPAEEVPAAETPAEEAPAEEVPAEEAPAAEPSQPAAPAAETPAAPEKKRWFGATRKK